MQIDYERNMTKDWTGLANYAQRIYVHAYK